MSKCIWSPDIDGDYDDPNVYETECKNVFVIIEGTPKDNNFKYCLYCGKEIIEPPTKE